MRLALLGNSTNWAIENEFVEGLSNQLDLKFINSYGAFLNYYQKGILNKILFRLGISRILHKVNAMVLEEIKIFQPDAVLVFKGMEIFPSTLKLLRKQGVYLMNYNPDHPFEYVSRGSGNANVLNSIPHFHHHFSYSKEICNDLKTKYSVHASWLPFAYFNDKTPLQEIKIRRICFIGNPDMKRVSLVKEIAEAGIPIDVYGVDWDNHLSEQENSRTFPPVFQSDFTQTAQQYLAHINVFRTHNIGSHNMRSFEIPAIGGIMVAPYSNEHASFFMDKSEAFFYHSDSELIKILSELIQMPDDELYRLKINAYNRIAKGENTYQDRANEVFKHLKENISPTIN